MFLRNADNLPSGKNQAKVAAGSPNKDHPKGIGRGWQAAEKELALRHDGQDDPRNNTKSLEPGNFFVPLRVRSWIVSSLSALITPPRSG